MENKGCENPRACICRHAYVYTCSRSAYACFMHVYAYTSMRTHARVLETMKGKFFALKLRFGMNLTSSGSYSKPLFSQYKKPYMVPFQETQKILKENLKFTRNSEPKMDFLQNILNSIFFWLRPFLVLIFEFWNLLINFVWLWIDWLKETIKIKPRSYVFEVIL